MNRTRPGYEFTHGVGFLIIKTNSRVMQRFIAPADLLVSLAAAEATSKPSKKIAVVIQIRTAASLPMSWKEKSRVA
jgi:hypothetical protein